MNPCPTTATPTKAVMSVEPNEREQKQMALIKKAFDDLKKKPPYDKATSYGKRKTRSGTTQYIEKSQDTARKTPISPLLGPFTDTSLSQYQSIGTSTPVIEDKKVWQRPKKPKLKKTVNAKRLEANQCEKERMKIYREALGDLKKKLPDNDATSFSELRTIKTATQYIKHLQNIVRETPTSPLVGSSRDTSINPNQSIGTSTPGIEAKRVRQKRNSDDRLSNEEVVKEAIFLSPKKPCLDEMSSASPLIVSTPRFASDFCEGETSNEGYSLVDKKAETHPQIRELGDAVNDIGAHLATLDQLNSQEKIDAIDDFIKNLTDWKSYLSTD